MINNKFTELNELRRNFSYNKTIPKQYEYAILKALAHYPELKHIQINFELVKKHPVPYGTTPGILSLFKVSPKRTYTISLLEEAEPPMEAVLLKNLPEKAQIGVLGHEIAHVIQYNSWTRVQLIKNMLLYLKPAFKKRIERGADLLTIKHGLGAELYEHATFIRGVPGYLEERKEIDKNYLRPIEILYQNKR